MSELTIGNQQPAPDSNPDVYVGNGFRASLKGPALDVGIGMPPSAPIGPTARTGSTFVRASTNDGGRTIQKETSDFKHAEVVQNFGRTVPWIMAIDPHTRSHLQPSQVNADTILTMPGGFELTLRQAIDAGYITGPFDGGAGAPRAQPQYKAVEQPQEQPQSSPENQPEDHPDLKQVPLSPEVEQQLADVAANTSSLLQFQAINDLADHGELGEATIVEAAAQMGVEAAGVSKVIETLTPHFERQAENVIGEESAPYDMFIEWAWEAKPKEMRAAFSRHIGQRNPEGYRPLAREFFTNMDRYAPDEVLGAQYDPGVRAERHASGRVLLHIPGRNPMFWSEAVAMGLIGKPTRG